MGSNDTMKSTFAQPDHLRAFHYVVDCFLFTMILTWLPRLAQVIDLVGLAETAFSFFL